MKTKKAFLCIFSCFLFFSCEFLDYKEKDGILPQIDDGKGGNYFEDTGELTSSGTNFEAPWAPGDEWNYGGGWCSNVNNPKYESSAHFVGKKDRNCIDINYINKGNSDLGMPFFAVFDGCVVKNELSGGYGNLLIIQSSEDKNIQFKMGHHDEISFLKVGECVKKGQIISYCGSKGDSTFAHGHYCIEEKQNGVYSSIPFNKIGEHDYSEKDCLKGDIINIKSTNDFEFKRIEEEFGTNFFGDILYNNLGYRGIHWYYDFVVNGSTSFSSTNQNNVLIQDWQNYTENRRSAIVYDVLHGARRGYVVHSGFVEDPNHGWLQDSSGVNTSGPRSKLGVPLSNEFVENGRTYQNFMFGYLSWKYGYGVSYQEYPTDGYPVGEVSLDLANDTKTLTEKIKVQDYQYAVNWSKKFSYLFVDAYNKSQKDGYWPGFTVYNNVTNEAAVDYIYSYPNYYKYFIQEFYNSHKAFLKNSTIIYDPNNNTSLITNNSEILGGDNKAYVVKGGFWNLYKQIYINGQDAFDFCGAPVMGESRDVPYWVQEKAGGVKSYQIFERCFLTWGITQNINVYIYNGGLFDCYNFTENVNNPTNYIVSQCDILEPCTENEGQYNADLGDYCDEFQQLYCWDAQTCDGSGYFSPDIWSPVLPEEFPPKCVSSYGLEIQYPESWECCCGFPIDWDGSGGNNCVEKWGEYGDVELVGTAPDLEPEPEPDPPPPTQEPEPNPPAPEPEINCPRTCLPGMKFQCWDMLSCENYGSGYGSPPLWTSDCYSDTPPNCGNWSGEQDKKPTYWQCCCGYDIEWMDGQNNACRSSVYNSFN
ncbi:MAG: M23 family metallopeptidase [Candidatus Magasanikbacteria bacterium]|nr:M23 family metallopeptidase [Candidatus Magasanikbacteria bacterium]